MVTDISPQKALESEQDQFVLRVGHELKSASKQIHLALQMLNAQTLALPASTERARLKDAGEDAGENAERIFTLVNNLCDFQQLKLGQMPFTPHACGVASLINQAIDQRQVMAQAREVTLSTQPCDLQVWADGDRIVQVLINLIGNAITFSHPGGTVSITARQIENQRAIALPPHIKFQVRDQAEGIPTDRLESLLGAFQPSGSCGSSGHSSGTEGTGLGLAICPRHHRTAWGQHHHRKSTRPGHHGLIYAACVDRAR